MKKKECTKKAKVSLNLFIHSNTLQEYIWDLKLQRSLKKCVNIYALCNLAENMWNEVC